MDFKRIGLEDLEILRRELEGYCGRICDISPANLVFWRDYYDISYYVGEGGIALRFGNMDDTVSYYCGTNSALIDKVISREGGAALFSCLTLKEAEYIAERYEATAPENSRDWDDYIYCAADIAELKGKRYCGQRNHINKFNKLYSDVSFDEIKESDIEDVKAFIGEYFDSIGEGISEDAVYERAHLEEQLDNLGAYGQLTGVLRVEGKVVGFSIGEIVGDTLIIHTEKADTAYNGVYPKIVKCFAEKYAHNALYINREEDCGDAGLRISKLSYHPLYMLPKYHLRASLKKKE
ncbi:MAG: DUF2156 domain-containing protein [Ruminococcaceae bacterium]|nr:DUF2156 domain-containing protein [Oscillospiraceae bacterium]